MNPTVPLKLFVSYAHKDKALADRLLDSLRDHLQCCTQSDCQIWIDKVILCGDRWDDKIRQALATADLGLLLVSPAFSCSRYIKDVELPSLLEKGCLPVGMALMNLQTQLDPALRAQQVFRYQARRSGPLFFSQCVTAAQREAFIFELYQQILARCQSLAAHP